MAINKALFYVISALLTSSGICHVTITLNCLVKMLTNTFFCRRNIIEKSSYAVYTGLFSLKQVHFYIHNYFLVSIIHFLCISSPVILFSKILWREGVW